MQTRVASFGIFVALALIFSYIEGLIPIQLGIPGIKLGLANLIVVIALYKLSWKEAMILTVVRVLLAGFIFGNLFSIVYSMVGALLSVVVMIGLKKSDKFSITGVSIAGGAAHNTGQMAVAMLAIGGYSILYYLPVLLAAGVLTGFVIGIAANEMLKRLVKIK